MISSYESTSNGSRIFACYTFMLK